MSIINLKNTASINYTFSENKSIITCSHDSKKIEIVAKNNLNFFENWINKLSLLLFKKHHWVEISVDSNQSALFIHTSSLKNLIKTDELKICIGNEKSIDQINENTGENYFFKEFADDLYDSLKKGKMSDFYCDFQHLINSFIIEDYNMDTHTKIIEKVVDCWIKNKNINSLKKYIEKQCKEYENKPGNTLEEIVINGNVEHLVNTIQNFLNKESKNK